MSNFHCNGCGQSPCIKKCEELCSHGIAKRDFCDDCYIDDNESIKCNHAVDYHISGDRFVCKRCKAKLSNDELEKV